MKLVSFEADGVASYGTVRDGGIVDIGRKLGAFYPELIDVIREDAFDKVREADAETDPDIALDDVRLLRPIPRPGKIICVGVNYANRNAEYKDDSDLPKYPSIFMRTPESFAPHGAPLLRPPESEQLDYEGEIALVIGKPGRRIPEANFREHIFGLTCLNEGTIRDWLRHGKFNVTQGKNFPDTGSYGPWIVTADEFPSFDDLRVTTRVNGEVRQDDTTANLIFRFPYLLNYISTFTELFPGDIIATGTPTGAGARFDPPIWLKPGDTLEVEVSGIGTLRNPIADEGA
jgi:5-carboxymethyl-2-hydroxymuconate isomerase